MAALLFFDIDGTLITLDKTHAMPESAKRALRMAREKGNKIFINSGRVKSAIDRHLLSFGFDGLVCGCGTYIEYEGQEIFHHEISRQQCIEYARLLHNYHYETLFEGKDRMFIDGEHGLGSFMGYIYHYFSENSDYPIDSYEHEEFIFDKFTTNQSKQSDSLAFTQTFSEAFHLIPHTDRVIEAVPRGFSKATGIQFLMDYLHTPIEDCYAFGDSVNDMEMLKFVKHSVAMGGSAGAVLDVVEYQTTGVLENGLYNALEYYRLI